jgi:serine/threonine-protein kinase
MLSGEPPFRGETAVDIVIKHMNEKVPSICRVRPDLPVEMNDFMQRALAKQPADRYATPREFINALEQIQDRLREMPPIERAGRNGDAKPRPYNNVPAPPPQKEARLIVLSNGQPIPLRGDLMVVGRQDPTLGIFPEINLADKTVGRRHAYLRHQQGNYTVEDLNALNKTRLNGVTLTPHEERSLKDGDILRFGSVEVRFELR